MVEFALVAIILFVVIFGCIEFDRLLLVYTSVANSAREGVRYAIVHGSDRTGTGTNGPSSSSSYVYVTKAVTDFAALGLLDTSRLTVTVTYVDGTNTRGSRVRVQTTYPYDPMTSFFPITTNLSSTAEGVITW